MGGARSTGETSDEPTGPPGSSAGETSPAETDEPSAEAPQTVVTTKTGRKTTTVFLTSGNDNTAPATSEGSEGAVPTGPAEECEDEEETDASSGVFAGTSGIDTDASTEGTDPSTDESPSPISTGADAGPSTVEVTAPIPTIPSSGASTG
ncbi:hypothetical protein IMZ48_38300, partial [Candidatus Bathyarchaeota archaeon]|nr:hypothetical protein [Candidatus Bathyarchaeota archaeon]